MKRENACLNLGLHGSRHRITYTILVIILLVAARAGFAQPAGDCFPGSCTAQNFNLINVYLGDINGNPLPEGYCTSGDSVTAYIWVNMQYTQAADRQSLYVEFDLWENGVLTDSFYDCFYEGLQIPGEVNLNLLGINWTCGDKVELKNLYVSWGPPNADTCICSNSQCYNNPIILVDAPLIPNFQFEAVCEANDVIQRYQFTNLSTGGEGTLSYSWNFGVDGSGNTTAVNPLVSYSSTGVKQVTLTVTDSRVPPRVQSITKDVTVTECPDPDIILTKTASPQTYGAVDDVITYEIVVENTGNVPLSNIVVSDPQATSGPSYVSGDDGDTVLQPGETWTYTASYTVTLADLLAGSFSNTASVVGKDPENQDIADEDSEQVTAIRANLSIQKTGSPEPVMAGAVLTYTIIVTNLGENTAEDVVITDIINGAELLTPEFSLNGGMDWDPWVSPYNIGSLGVGNNFELLLRGIVSPDIAPGSTVSNTASVASVTFDPDLSNNTATESTDVIVAADVSIVKTGAPNPPIAGEVRTYTIVVSNAGPSDAAEVHVSDIVPAVIQNAQYSVDGSPWAPWVSPYLYGALAVGGSFTIEISGTVNPNVTQGSLIVNTAVVMSDTPDPNLSNNTSTDSVSVNAQSDVSIVKSQIDPAALPSISAISPSVITAGTTIYYYLEVLNNGPSYAANLLIEDLLPAGISNAEYSLNFGNSWQPWSGTRSLPAFSYPGANYILIRGDVAPDLTGTLTNTGTVSSDTPDPDLSNNSSTVVTTIEQSADLILTKEEVIAPVSISGPIEYVISILNDGPSDAVNITVDDVIDTGVISGVEYSVDGGGIWNTPWNGSLNIPSLAYGASYELWIRGTVVDASPDPNVDPIPNTATVSASTPDPDLENNTQTIQTPLDVEADLAIVKVGPISVVAGEWIEYTITVTNTNGTFDAENVTVLDNINDNFIGTPEYSTDGGANWDPWTGSLDVGTVNASGSYVFLLRGQVLSDVTTDVPNTAQVVSDTPDSNPENDVSSVLTPVVLSADVEVVKLQIDPGILPLDPVNLPADLNDLAVDPATVTAGEEIYYLLVYSNYGPSDATNYLINDSLPAGILNPEASRCQAGFSSWIGSFNAGTVVAGGRCIIIIRGLVDSGVTGELTNTAVVSSDVPDPDLSNNESTFVTGLDNSADLVLVKESAPNPVTAGQLLTYTFTVTNLGASDAQGVAVTDAVPGAILNPEVSPDGGSWSPWADPYIYGDLAAGGSFTFFIRGIVSPGVVQGSQILNVATVGAQTPDPNLSNNTDRVVSNVNAAADLAILKTAAPEPVTAGQTLTYTVTVQNLGPSAAANVVVTDFVPAGLDVVGAAPSVGSWNAPAWSLGTLALGASETLTITATVTELANGTVISNTATVGSTTLDPQLGNNVSTALSSVVANPALSIDKVILSGNPYSAVNQVVEYQYTISNSGDVPLAGPFTVVDDVIGTLTDCAVGPLLPGESTVCTASYLIVQSDLDNGSVYNTAYASTTYAGQVVNSSEDHALANAISAPALQVTKDASPLTYSAAGETITYTITVENTGNVTVYDISVTDPLTGLNAVIPSLAPGVSQMYNQSYVIVQADLDNGSVANTATASGIAPNEEPVSDSDDATVTANQQPGLAVTKTASPLTYSAVGEVITYTIVVENTGNVTVSNIAVTDPLTGLSEMILSLAPGVSETYTQPYVIVQADLDAGSVVNVATASGTAPDQTPVSGSDSETIAGSQQPGLVVTKTASPSTYSTVGEVITYTITVENTGNVTISGVAVTDPLTGLNETIPSLAPSALETYTQTYAITQADLDTGSVLNTAVATGMAPDETTVSDTDDETITASQLPGLLVTKTASPSTYSAVGDVITYTIVVQNTGNVTVSSVVVTDPLTGLSETIASLAPGASETYTQTHIITQADLDAGSVMNTATAIGADPNEDPVSDDDSETVTGEQSPGLLVTKTASPSTYSAVGDVITYTIVVANTGNVTLSNIAVTDPLTGLNETIPSLAPGASETYTQTYTVTQADLDAGSVVNTAAATGTAPNEDPVSDDDSETVTAEQSPGLVVTKTASPDTYSAVGDAITYTIVVENTGNVTLSNIAVTDPLTGLSETITSLAPGASETYTQTYTITQADLDEGRVTNTAAATGTAPNEDPVSDDDSETVTAEQSPGLVVTKTASPATYSAVGDVITYTIVVENTGNVTVSNVAVTDPLTGLNETIASLAPGASETYTQTYTITQADLDAGSVTNTAAATGTDPNEEPVTDDDSETVRGEQSPGLSVTKTASPATYSAVGDVITYTIVVKNSGNVTLSSVAVTDPLTGLNVTIASLAPDASETYTQTYVITQADLDAGSVVNTATASGTAPNEESVSDSDTETVTAEQQSGLSVTKTASPDTYSAVGDVITYTIVVENSGNVTLSNVTVTDPLTSLSATIPSLAPGASETYTQTYTITQADLDAGSVVNTAAATGTAPNEEPVTDEDSETVRGEQSPGLSVTKTASPDTYNAVGDVITYTIVVENTGNVTVSNVTVTDPLTSLSATIASLAPGASETYTQTYTITQDDLDAGSVVNTVAVSGDGPGEDPVSDEDEETVTAEQNPAVVVTKSASPEVYGAVDDVITYTIVVENTGNVTVSNVVVTDPLTGLDVTIASLAPGASETYTQTYTITQADLDALSVVNTATASFTYDDETYESTASATVDAQVAEEECCSGFNILDPANIFLGALALLALLLMALFSGGGIPSKF